MENLDGALENFNKLLIQNGILIATIPVADTEKLLFYSQFLKKVGSKIEAKSYMKKIRLKFKHVNQFSLSKWKNLFEIHNFEIIKVRKYLSPN